MYRLLLIASPISPHGGTIRRLQLWSANIPQGVQLRLLWFSSSVTSGELAFHKADASASVVESRWLGRSGRTTVLPAAGRILREIGRFNPHGVLTLLPWNHVAGAAAALLRSRRRPWTFGMYVAGDLVLPPHVGRGRHMVYSLAFPPTLSVADRVIVLSRGMHDNLISSHSSIDPAKLRVVPIGVPIPEAEHSRKFGTQDVVFGVLSRFVPSKGIPDLLLAFDQVRRRVGARLVIYGDGPERSKYESMVGELGMQAVVTFGGWASDPVAAARGFDCCVLPSHSEGTPRSILEAASVGVPTIATHVGGVPDLIEGEVTGWLVPPGEPDVLASVMERVAHSPSILSDVGANARRAVQRRHAVSDEVGRVVSALS